MGSVECKAERCEEAGRFHEVAGVSNVVAGGPHSTTGTLAVDSPFLVLLVGSVSLLQGGGEPEQVT